MKHYIPNQVVGTFGDNGSTWRMMEGDYAKGLRRFYARGMWRKWQVVGDQGAAR